ncbi:MAG: TraR/DksA C4-type zinc finger protein [Candidatus Hydrogenedentes bacterium]|nr:TraR/DksA C4-type zinc finger protein [Candidatus Hydrogenedentota bacterium]
MLPPEELEHYKAQLLQRQQEIETQFSQLEEMSQPVSPDPSIGRLTRQDAMQQQQMTLESRRRLELQQTQLKTALKRIEDEKFGLCVLCKEPIAAARLEIVPESPLCVPCLENRNSEPGHS